MDKPTLNNPNIQPTPAVLLKHLKKAMPSFVELFEYSRKTYPEFEERWKYYNDVRYWLLNVSKKKKTIFWLSVYDGYFRVTIYLSQKYASLILNSELKNELKQAIENCKEKKNIDIIIDVKQKKDLALCKKALKLKIQLI